MNPLSKILALSLSLAPIASAALDDSLLGYYPFETNYDNAITTGGLPNGSAVNTPAAGTAGGRVGNAMSLQGADNDHMTLPVTFGSGNTLGETFTISAWYKLNDPITSPTSTNRYFVYETTNNYTVSYGIRDLGTGTPGINDSQVFTQTGNFNISDAALPGWHHIIQTYTVDSGTITIRSYIDGSHVGNLSIASSSFSGLGLNFGAARNSQTNRGFDGLIDEVAIWDRELTSAELATVYALGLNSKPLISNDPPSTPPAITSFTATPGSIPLGGSSTLAWNVTGSTSVTIVDEPGNVAASGNQSVTPTSEKTYTLVAINGNAVTTSQVTITISGPTDPVGPMVGTVTQTDAHLLYRPGPDETDLRLTVINDGGGIFTTVDSTSLASNDYVAKFHVTGLTSGKKYLYRIDKVETGGGTTLYAGGTPDFFFKTVPPKRTNQVLNVGFISCVNDTTDELWTEMGNHNLDLLCLAGDTPYVDTGDLTLIREKHRHFLQRPTLSPLLKNISTVGIWDDHDFGLNNGNGVNTASRKANTRRGFVEYRAHDKYGNNNEGVYHKTDLGAMEIFLLDPRWFSQTAGSPVAPTQSTCFGSVQWQWILDSIRNSKAPFKVLLQGQIWQDKKNSETDDMFTYYTERDALLDIIRDEKIPGVVLFGGDIHVARYLMHPQRVGYDLHDFVMSPGHKSVISSLNVYHPSLEWSHEAVNQFLTMKADTTKSIPELTVRYLDKDGNINHEVVIPYHKLTYQNGTGLAKDLRAYWNFDNDFANQTLLGSRIDATAENGATRVDNVGVRGGAAGFTRANSQYLSIPRSFLDDNTPVYTASAWCKNNTLPAHGTSERQFIMESKAHDHVNLPGESTSAYAISVGLRATTDPTKVNLQLYTETLSPRAIGSQQAPGTAAQGGYDLDVDRTLFDNWTHVVVTFDSSKLQLYLNGSFAIEHTLTTAAPIAETGGFVIGGHRAGTGRNYDGLIDEVAIWNRVLTPAEITSLYNSGNALLIPTEVSILDSDNDALPDYWEHAHGLNPLDNTDALSDLDHDNLPALQEFGFGTLPGQSDTPSPCELTLTDVGAQTHLTLIYPRNPAALDFLEIGVQRSTDLGLIDLWSTDDVTLVSVTPLPGGLEKITERSTIPSTGQAREFLRVNFTKK